MCFEMPFGKYQLKGKKSNNVESFLCINDADDMFYSDISVFDVCVFFFLSVYNLILQMLCLGLK